MKNRIYAAILAVVVILVAVAVVTNAPGRWKHMRAQSAFESAVYHLTTMQNRGRFSPSESEIVMAKIAGATSLMDTWKAWAKEGRDTSMMEMQMRETMIELARWSTPRPGWQS